MSEATPRVTVLLPVHQGRAHLPASVGSILAQSFRDFELLVVDDGSTDGTAEWLATCEDPRLRVLRHAHNRGIVEALNHGLEQSRGEIVARMDADDVSLPRRLERQLDFLDAHPEVGACGTWTVGLGRRRGRRDAYPTDAPAIRCRQLFGPALAHPTVCLRRGLFAREGLRYDPAYPHAEDYDLWRRASERFPLANLDEVLLRHRVHDASVSRRHLREQQASVERIHRELLAGLGLAPSEEQLRIHRGGRAGEPDPPLAETERWLLALLRANRETRRYPEPAFARAVAERWLRAARRAIAQRQRAWSLFARSPLSREIATGERLHVALRALSRGVRDLRRIRRPSRNPAL